MTDSHNPSSDANPSDARDEAVGRLINEYFDRRESGEIFTEDEFLEQHAEYADELREHLKGLDLIKGIGSSSAADGLENNRTRSIARQRKDPSHEAEEIHIPDIPGYQIHRPLGRGGMGIVYKAVQTSTGRQVALKVLLEGPFAAPQSRKRFEREIALSAQLRHPNIIPIYDSGRNDGRSYYAMEYVRGLPLDEYIEKEDPALNKRLRLFLKVGAALRHAHQRGVIHRDLKPTNVLVNADGEPHLLDFGLAKQGTFSDMTTSLTAQIIGTPAYMSPEQAAGDPSGIDVRTDVYSMGVVLFELVSGKMPYETNVSIGKLLNNIAKNEPNDTALAHAGVDAELTAIILKALEKNKDDRYQSVDAFVGDVNRYLADEPISVRPASGVYLFRKAIWKHRIAVAAVLIAASLFGMAGYIGHKINAALEDNRRHIAQQDAKLKAQEEEAKQIRDALKKKEDERRVYENIVKQLQLNPELFNAFSKTVAEGQPDLLELARGLAKVGDFGMGDDDANEPTFKPGKDLEAGRRDVVIGDTPPDLLMPVPSQPSPDIAPPTMFDKWWALFQETPPEDGDEATTSQPTSQPADSVVDANDNDDDSSGDSSEDASNATNRS